MSKDGYTWTLEDQKAMDEMYADLARYEEECNQHNNRIFKAIKNVLGIKYMEDVIDCLEETESSGKLSIVDAPNAKLRQNEDWGSFDHVYVDQYVNGGMEGDSFAGWFYIPLKKGKYLKTHYEM